MENISRCEWCNAINHFRWDGRHLICSDCGGVHAREILNPSEIAEIEKEKKKELEKKLKKEEKLRRERYALDGYYERMPIIEDWCADYDFFA